MSNLSADHIWGRGIGDDQFGIGCAGNGVGVGSSMIDFEGFDENTGLRTDLFIVLHVSPAE